MNQWIAELDEPTGDGPRLAVKDAIDVAGVPTTVGCKAIADAALRRPSERRAMRRDGARRPARASSARPTCTSCASARPD